MRRECVLFPTDTTNSGESCQGLSQPSCGKRLPILQKLRYYYCSRQKVSFGDKISIQGQDLKHNPDLWCFTLSNPLGTLNDLFLVEEAAFLKYPFSHHIALIM